jgi:hypothetical protein
VSYSSPRSGRPIIKPGMDTKQVVAHFEAERQALAMMDHPDIAKVFDGGAAGIKDEGGRTSVSTKDDGGRTPIGYNGASDGAMRLLRACVGSLGRRPWNSTRSMVHLIQSSVKQQNRLLAATVLWPDCRCE